MLPAAIRFEEKPTSTGLAIRLSEWNAFIAAVQQLMQENEQLADIHPCGDQHPSIELALAFRECHPFQRGQGVM